MKTQVKITGQPNQIQNFSYIFKSLTLERYENAGSSEFVLTIDHADEIEIKNKLLTAKTADEINQIDLELSGEVNKFVVREDLTKVGGYNTIINDIEINEKVFDDDMVDYRWVDRVDLIKDIQQRMAEARQMGRDSDAELMDADIDYLKTLNDNYVFSSTSTNEYVSAFKNPRQFNEICQEILESNQLVALTSLHQKIQNNEEVPASEFSKIDFESEAFNSLDDSVKETITNYVNERSDAINADALEKEKQQSTSTDLNV